MKRYQKKEILVKNIRDLDYYKILQCVVNSYSGLRCETPDCIICYTIDYINMDRTYWKSLFKAIYESKLSNKRKIIKDICQARYEKRNPPAIWENYVSEEIKQWVYRVIDWGIKKGEIEESCMDNIRCGKIGHKRSMLVYKRQRDQGCCGYYDRKHKGPDGRDYIIGCNFGH